MDADPTVSSADPLAQWQGDFGDRYIARNEVTDTTVGQAEIAFGRILDQSGIRGGVRSILEVGANVGINLHGLRRTLGPDVSLMALEPNTNAGARLRGAAELGLDRVIAGSGDSIDLPDASVDLVFTNGVLIHVHPDSLRAVMREICRVARRWVLCSEYFSHQPVEVPYHGESGMLWKRDFGREYLEVCPELRVRSYGFLWAQELPNYDDLNWWVFEKPDAPAGRG